MGDHLLGAIVGQRKDAAAVGHQPAGPGGQGHQAEGAHFQRGAEAVAAGRDELAFEVFLLGERDGVDEAVDRAELGLGLGEEGVELVVLADVAGFDEIAAGLGRQGSDAVLQRLAGVAEANGGAFLMEGLRDAPGDGAFVGDAEDQGFLAAHQSHGKALSCLVQGEL